MEPIFECDAERCTLHGSGMHSIYLSSSNKRAVEGVREVTLTPRDRFGNTLGRAFPGLFDAFSCTLTEGGADMPDDASAAVEQTGAGGEGEAIPLPPAPNRYAGEGLNVEVEEAVDGTLKAKYGLRVMGTFTLVVTSAGHIASATVGVSFLLFTVIFHANRAHNLIRPP